MYIPLEQSSNPVYTYPTVGSASPVTDQLCTLVAAETMYPHPTRLIYIRIRVLDSRISPQCKSSFNWRGSRSKAEESKRLFIAACNRSNSTRSSTGLGAPACTRLFWYGCSSTSPAFVRNKKIVRKRLVAEQRPIQSRLRDDCVCSDDQIYPDRFRNRRFEMDANS